MQVGGRTALAVAMFLAAGCGGPGGPAVGNGPAGPVAPAGHGATTTADGEAAWSAEQPRLRPGDVIRLQIWREPELSGEFAIDQRGTVFLPRIGELAATSMPPDVLEAQMREAFARYLRNPSIEITMLRRINVLGAVRSPGLYPLDPTMTLADALAAAGGILPHGRPGRVEIVRDDARVVVEATHETRVFDLGLRSGDQLYIPERTWVSRNAAVIATVASTVISATVSLIIAFSR